MLQKFSKCEVKAAWLANYTILLPQKSYVKSNICESEWSKMKFLSILEGLNFDFGKFLQFFYAKNGQNSDSEIRSL